MSVNYGNLSFSPLEPYSKIITQYVDTIKNILTTVSDLGFSAIFNNFQRAISFFGGSPYFFLF